MERLRRVATCLVVGIGGGHRGAPWPVSLAYPGGSLLPLKLRAFIDFAAQRLKLALSDGSDRSRSMHGTSLVRPPDCHQTRTK